MYTEKNPQKFQDYCRDLKRSGHTIAFVPTMGALHAGHLSLVRLASQHCDRVVVSIYVNPTQFAPGEDLDRYPRRLKADLDALSQPGVAAVFTPDDQSMYPEGFQTSVRVEDLSRTLCGRSRPTHFNGVTTIVSKLFNIVAPNVAVFGEKDYQQAAIIRRMVADLNYDIQVVTGPIVREDDGLAMSSRNRYLTPEERNQATVLNRCLQLAHRLVYEGLPARELLDRVRSEVAAAPLAKPDYMELVHPDTLQPVSDLQQGALLALAVFFGKTRLIDNTVLPPTAG